MRTPDRNLNVVVSGSFHRHMAAIGAAVDEFTSRTVRVLSPADPRVVAANGEFLFVASDRVRSVRLVQDRHLEAIRAADFLWLVCPDGYVGQSASMEVGFAAAAGVPVFSTHVPTDLTLRQYVTIVPTLMESLRIAARSARLRPCNGILVDPHASVEEAHKILDRIQIALTRTSANEDPSRRVYDEVINLQSELRTPGRMQ